jgi:hypothetical protein
MASDKTDNKTSHETMTVSAALRRIKKVKGLIAERTARANASVVYLEGKEPGFLFNASVEERKMYCRQLVRLQSAVAISNATTKLSDGKTVAEAIRTLDEIKSEVAFFKAMPVKAKHTEVDIEENHEWNPNMTARIRVETKKTWHSALTQEQRAAIVEKLTSLFEVGNNEVEALNNKATIEVDL